MGKSLFLTLILTLAVVSTATAQIPPGFEIVEIRSGEEYHHLPRINNCGEVVFYVGFAAEDDSDIYRYDNGALLQVTDNDLPDAFPDINDEGTIVWTRGFDGSEGGEIVRLYNGEESSLGQGAGPSINNLGHVAWRVVDAQSCAYEASIVFYDGETVEQITDDGLSNQSVRLNDSDEMCWTRYDFCKGPWTSDIMLYSYGTITQLPSMQTTPQGPNINNVTEVAWANFDVIELWEDGLTVPFTDGHIPSLNDVGDIAFQRKIDSFSYWQIWVHLDGTFYQITDSNSFHSGRAAINDAGEVAWNWNYENLHPTGVRFLRRTRNGEGDFDGDVDLDDFELLQACLTGPVETDRLCECRFLDIDHDRDVDLADFAGFQNLFTGEN